MLNFSTGAGNMQAACRLAGIRTIVTSRRFVLAAKLGAAVATLGEGRRIIYLEELRQSFGLIDRLRGLIESRFARTLYRRRRVDPEAAAVVLFTSGSEGTPKGVVLSHRNILANCQQIAARVDFSPSDIVFNALPLFHSFGMTGGMLLPLANGVRRLSLSLAAPLPDRAGAGLRHQRHHPLRHRHLPLGLRPLRQPL